jgi:hypothetical protein
MWTGLAVKKQLFTPHANTCVTGEVYVPIAGATTGFCMDADLRSEGEVTWTQAKELCAASNKRLPEPAEFVYACNNPPIGLVNMTNTGDYYNDAEWASNTPINLVYTSGYYGESAPEVGYGSCTNASVGWIGRNDNVGDAVRFRCVH